MTNSSLSLTLDDDDGQYLEHLHGDILALTEHVQELETEMIQMRQFMNQTRLLMGALLQQQSPEAILQLLTNAHPESESQEPQ